jgi:hypothetical protein
VDTAGRRGDEGEAARRLLTCLLYAAANLGVGIADAVEWLDDASGAALVRALLAVQDRDARAMSWLASVVDRQETARAAFSTAGRLLWLHFGQALTEPAGRSIFRPRELLGGDNTLFIAVPPVQQEHTPGLTTSLLLAVLAEAENLIAGRGSRRLPRPLLIVLDDCADAAPVDQLLDFLSVAEDVGITLLATCTDLGQWQARYGARAAGLVDRARAVMFLGGEREANDAATMELLHRLVRRQLLERAARRRERDADAEDEDLLTPEAAGQLGLGRGVLIAGQAPPALLWLRNSYRDLELQQRQVEHPFIRGVTRIRPGRR